MEHSFNFRTKAEIRFLLLFCFNVLLRGPLVPAVQTEKTESTHVNGMTSKP